MTGGIRSGQSFSLPISSGCHGLDAPPLVSLTTGRRPRKSRRPPIVRSALGPQRDDVVCAMYGSAQQVGPEPPPGDLRGHRCWGHRRAGGGQATARATVTATSLTGLNPAPATRKAPEAGPFCCRGEIARENFCPAFARSCAKAADGPDAKGLRTACAGPWRDAARPACGDVLLS